MPHSNHLVSKLQACEAVVDELRTTCATATSCDLKAMIREIDAAGLAVALRIRGILSKEQEIDRIEKVLADCDWWAFFDNLKTRNHSTCNFKHSDVRKAFNLRMCLYEGLL